MNSRENSEREGVLVIGARTRRQGTGPFIAAGLAAAGLPVTGIVGTSAESVDEARAALARDWQLSPEGFTQLDEALTELRPQAVAICSPWQVHTAQLQTVAEAGCHCLVEKPMAWPANTAEAESLIAQFSDRELLLQVVNQWPTTLGAFAELHDQVPDPVEHFRMRLSPISIGPDMVTDSAPHFLGMLDALCGPGDCEDVRLRHGEPDATEQSLELQCRYRHQGGTCEATLLLQTQLERPRPAWYQVNDLRVDREVELPEYRQYLVAPQGRVAMEDPIHQVTREFVTSLDNGCMADSERLLAMHNNLLQLAVAWN